VRSRHGRTYSPTSRPRPLKPGRQEYGRGRRGPAPGRGGGRSGRRGWRPSKKIKRDVNDG
jgi:hypothetical protein